MGSVCDSLVFFLFNYYIEYRELRSVGQYCFYMKKLKLKKN